jgi:hypothetical protein
MEANDIEVPRARFTRNGKGSWYVRSYCMSPTVDMRDEETGQTVSFGMDGSLTNEFTRKERGDE